MSQPPPSAFADPAVAYAVLRSLIRDLGVQTRNGLPVPVWADRVLRELASTCDIGKPAIGTGFETVEVRGSNRLISVGEAAANVGRSEEYVRRLVRSGKVIGHRVGARTWAVDLDSLRGVLGEAA